MSEGAITNNSEKLAKNTKIAVFGISATAMAIFSYFIYKKFIKSNRSGSSSSDSADDKIILNSLNKKGPLKTSSPLKLKKQRSARRPYGYSDTGLNQGKSKRIHKRTLN